MPPEPPLDPCRQWLGVDATDLGDHRRVLGLSPDERDPLQVLRAAEAKLTALRGVSAGPLEFVRAGFVKRVEAARESLLAEIAAGSSEPSSAGTAFRRPPPPSTLPPAVAAAPRGPVVPPVPKPPVAPPAVPPPPAITTDIGAAPAPITIRTTVYRKKTPVVGITLSLLGLASLAGGLGYSVLVMKPARIAHPDRRTSAGDEDAADETAGVEAAPSGGGKSPPVADATDRPPPRARPRRPRTSEAAGSPQENKPSTAAAENAPAPSPRPAAVAMAKPRPEAAAAEAASPEEARRLDETLAKLLEALRDEEQEAVDSLLKTAAQQARTPDGRLRVTGWQRLATSYRKFIESRAAALDALEPGASYEVGGRKVVIEKIDAEECVFRAGGPPKTVRREKIPAGIVMAIVSAWSGGDADGDLANAAFQIVRPEPELRLAREWLDKGRQAGADVEPLIALLDDPLLAAGEGT